jgi:mono/diheme cytochrome c family protein
MKRIIVHALAFCVVLGMATVDLASVPRAQENLDRNQTGPKLFAASCVQCHKSARGLAKGRISFTLSYYLRSHYTSSAETASILTAYLQSVDTPPAKAKGATAKVQTGKVQTGKAQTGKADAGDAQPKNAKRDVETRLPTGTISEDPRVKPPARIPER